ncbi:MAG: hypothetical protein KDI31_12795 [Pseudomonadales bacterium]|nr:hypothetical protein [Pseudomonadales bacterium]
MMGALMVLAVPGQAAVETVADLQSEWAHITYETDAKSRAAALEALGEAARRLSDEHPEDAGLLIWQGIILSSYAGEAGGLGALGAAKRARAALEKSLELDETALDGSAYTSLGTLYYKVPGWPVGFGNDKKAREFLQRALSINPDGIDPNYFMGEFLFEEGDYAASVTHLRRALVAPGRAGRELADSGRRQEIQRLLEQVTQKL